MDLLPEIGAALAVHGLVQRGGFDFAEGEDAPAKAVLLVGNAGAGYWPHFEAWRKRQPPDIENPLDTWSRTVIGAIASRFGARAVSPSDRPFLPFQQWAMRAEGLKPSPLGILIHSGYGLWHAYRGALLFDGPLYITPATPPAHPCDVCVGRPCLRTCPVDACSPAGLAHGTCVEHVRRPSGVACLEKGCLARNACPVGESYRYPAAVQAFHQRSFAGL